MFIHVKKKSLQYTLRNKKCLYKEADKAELCTLCSVDVT